MKPKKLATAVTALGWLLATLLPGALTAAPIEGHSARYELSKDGMAFGVTDAVLSIADDGSASYETKSIANAFFRFFIPDRITERTRWRWERDTMLPLEYVYNRYGGKKKRLAIVEFDWVLGSASNTVSGKTWTMPVTRGTLDKLSIYPRLMIDLQAGGKTFDYPVADGGKLKTYSFRVTGTETIETEIGRIETVRVAREHADSKRHKETYIWFAPTLGYLPVRIDRIEDNDDLLRMEIIKITTVSPTKKAGP